MAAAKERLHPAPLLSGLTEGSFHALIVDKSQQKLSVWRVKNGEAEIVDSFRCSTGENPGDKWIRGDMKTPEGVYFFCSLIDGAQLPSKYGLWAFTTDYPNFIDKRKGKNGDGIWLHGRDKPIGPRPDSNGCVALENKDLIQVSKYIRLQGTPLIIVDSLKMVPRSKIIEQERKIRDAIEGWRSAWESKNIDRYMSHYSKNFQAGWYDYFGWKDKKTKLYDLYSKIMVRLGEIYLYKQGDIVTAIFTQVYRSESYGSTGIKVLYFRDEGDYKIYAEDYHQMIDDSFPVRTLLAKIGEDPNLDNEDEGNYKIRLVSTDEPEMSAAASEGDDAPRPSAPAVGVQLKKIAELEAESLFMPEALSNEKARLENEPERLIVAWLSYGPIKGAKQIVRQASIQDAAINSPPEPAPSVQAAYEPDTANPAAASIASHRPVENHVPQINDTEQNRYGEFDQSTIDHENSLKDAQQKNDSNERPKDLGERVREFLSSWKQAWEQKNLDEFIKMYHPKFEQDENNLAKFKKKKQKFFNKYKIIRVELDKITAKKLKYGLRVTFLQSFRGDKYSDKGWKTMVLAKGKGRRFQIISEEWRSVHSPPSDS